MKMADIKSKSYQRFAKIPNFPWCSWLNSFPVSLLHLKGNTLQKEKSHLKKSLNRENKKCSCIVIQLKRQKRFLQKEISATCLSLSSCVCQSHFVSAALHQKHMLNTMLSFRLLKQWSGFCSSQFTVSKKSQTVCADHWKHFCLMKPTCTA